MSYVYGPKIFNTFSKFTAFGQFFPKFIFFIQNNDRVIDFGDGNELMCFFPLILQSNIQIFAAIRFRLDTSTISIQMGFEKDKTCNENQAIKANKAKRFYMQY